MLYFNNIMDNERYKIIKNIFEKFIKSCHQLLYNESSIVGIKAQDDIMKLFCLKLLSDEFKNKKSKLYGKCLKIKNLNKIDDEDFDRYVNYCCDINNFELEDNIFDCWHELVHYFLSDLLNIYSKDDIIFNIPKDDETTLLQLINVIGKFEINDELKKYFHTICGDIHQFFRDYSGGKSSKELGQYFTPRCLINNILTNNKFMVNKKTTKIYDPCLGTGGFLSRFYKIFKIKSSNIYGCEIELSAIKFAEISLLLTTKKLPNKIFRCNSLCENKLLFKNDKMDYIISNPPFGTNIKYDDIKKKFNKFKSNNFKNSKVCFDEIYPIKVNNGACLFLQHCIYMLNNNGYGIIVLPMGQLFNGSTKWCITFRKWLLSKVCIKKIYIHDEKTFDYTDVLTATIIFVKGQKTDSIEYIRTSRTFDSINTIIKIKLSQIENNNFILSHNEYMINDTKIIKNNNILLNDLCDIYIGKDLKIKNMINGKYDVYGGGFFPIGKHNEYNSENSIIVSKNGRNAGHINICYDKFFATKHALVIKSKENVNIEYIYYYLKYKQDEIYKLQKYGSSIKSINKNTFEKIRIPIHSLKIQNMKVIEIKSIVNLIRINNDRMRLLDENLDLLIEKKYKYLLDKKMKDIATKKLKDICEITNGKKLTKNNMVNGKYNVIGSGKDYIGNHNIFNCENCIIIAKDGNYAGNVSYHKNKIFATSHAMILKPHSIYIKYLFRYLKNIQKDISKNAKNTIIHKSLTSDRINNFDIPIESDIIMNILDNIDSYKKSVYDDINIMKDDNSEYNNIVNNIFAKTI